MSFEICEYDGFIRPHVLSSDKKLKIKELSQGFGYEIELFNEHIELSYQGRDTGRLYLEFLKELSTIIGTAQGEITCVREGEDGQTHEIYTIENNMLFVQEVFMMKGEKRLVK